MPTRLLSNDTMPQACSGNTNQRVGGGTSAHNFSSASIITMLLPRITTIPMLFFSVADTCRQGQSDSTRSMCELWAWSLAASPVEPTPKSQASAPLGQNNVGLR